jgi:hypothetical protein
MFRLGYPLELPLAPYHHMTFFFANTTTGLATTKLGQIMTHEPFFYQSWRLAQIMQASDRIHT